MLETYSPSGSEHDLSILLLNELSKYGFTSHKDKAGNVIGHAGQEGPKILLCGHMDTVKGELPVFEKDGYIHGRGAVDAKSSLAAMIVGCAKAIHNHVPFQATIAGVVEEETTSKGIISITDDKTAYDLAVFGEPSGVSNIIIGYKGSVRLEITAQSLGGHSSSPWLSRNSLEDAFDFWECLRDTLLENSASSKFESITGALVSASSTPGGNSIPTHAVLGIDLRIPPRISPRELIQKLERFRASYSERSKAQIILQFGDETKAFLGADDSLGVRAFRYAIRKTTRSNVSLVKKTGTSDMNILAQFSQASMIAYGPGDSSLDHTKLEKVSISEYIDSIEIYSTAIEKFASLATRSLETANA